MFIVANLAGSTIQITTLPLPVLSTLQAVRLSPSQLWPSADLFPVWSGIQFYLCYADPRRAFYTMVVRRDLLGVCGSRAHCDFRSHRRTCAQPGPAPWTSTKTAIHTLDDRSGCAGDSDHHQRKNSKMDQSIRQEYSAHAFLPRNGLWSCQWNTISTFPLGCKVGS